MEIHVARMFNHGAVITNVFGWRVGNNNPFRSATESSEAITAYRKFLSGGTLSESSLDGLRADERSSLSERLRALPDKLRIYQSKGAT